MKEKLFKDFKTISNIKTASKEALSESVGKKYGTILFEWFTVNS
jgi:hypothetical protein